MTSEQLNCFNIYLDKQCKRFSKFTSKNLKKSNLIYNKSNSSTSSNLNSEPEDLDDDDNSDESLNSLVYDSKFYNNEEEFNDNILNNSDLYTSKFTTRQRFIPKRKAANLRERKRMKAINKAFDVSLIIVLIVD